MTKLMEWLSMTTVLFSVWYFIVFGYVQSQLLDKWMPLIILSPVILFVMFGIYAVSIVLFRVFTFNDCEDAAKELQQQIQQAKNDLKDKGFKC